MAAQPNTTIDAFLGGRVQVCQTRQGFRAGLDSLMLAASVPARAGDSVCDLGAGVGTASLCLAARIGGLHITAVEIDDELAALAQANAERNEHAQSYQVMIADVLKRPRTLKRQSFRHVLTNPPYHDIARGTRAPTAAKARATSSHARDLIEWLRFARTLAHPQGMVTAILPPEQIPQALQALSPEGQGVEIIPLWPKQGAPAKRLIIRVRMNARAPLLMQPGLVLHRLDGKPTEEAEAVLRHAAALTT
ncbi:MAG: methyltransferase [Alphaproteobacteria bacterium]|nr:methyltransferase [Alphaproteobacteria bacterium]